MAAPFCAPAALCLFKTCLFKSVHMLIVTFFSLPLVHVSHDIMVLVSWEDMSTLVYIINLLCLSSFIS